MISVTLGNVESLLLFDTVVLYQFALVLRGIVNIMVANLVVRILDFLFEKGLDLRRSTFIEFKLQHGQEPSDSLAWNLKVTPN